jgi:proline racemase
MRWSKTVTVVGAHAEGEIGRVIVGGVLPPPGATMFERMKHLENARRRPSPDAAVDAIHTCRPR